ncbi:MAG: tetratricopeptide repeat protein [Ketobacteraceae bacterium]|nr:tetratricopeptide repeat protein [Ketobacteraceae bacterium]
MPEKKEMVVGSQYFLPKQEYAPDGSKIPYKAMPNPQLQNKAPVDPAAIARFNRADQLLREGQHKAARKEFLSITKDFPALSGPWVRVAELEISNKSYGKAFEAYQSAIAANPDNMKARLDLGMVYRAQGYFAEAQETYLKALERWPDFAEAHYNLGVLYDLYVNNPVAAQKHFQAYYFLTGKTDEKVRKWLVELQRRSGDETDYIDQPPEPSSTTTPENPVIADKS